MTTKPLAFIYDRHATPTQAIMLLRVGACRQYAEERGWEIAGEWVDCGNDALTDDHRPEFDRMLANLLGSHRGGRTTVCVVCDWDRLSRDPEQRQKFARQVTCAGGWIETIAGETSKRADRQRGLLNAAPDGGA
ncbi:recombinase family protein [Streptomyces sp. RB6PN25]|uniref:Recombinase family protein n=1 Tax=Streptomyces humicola TaxID=2953240 RepID=A0ABT1PX30_9ACTN|nr:recombinase family protein [Streptomyces humicola]MCQ4082229.1 recombinase family protein [Streptomyces humicola]